MFKMQRYFCSALFIFLFAVCPSGLRAEPVAHHGMTADTRGTSRDCLSCHDGSIGHGISFCTSKCNLTNTHSVEKDYPPRGAETSYAPRESLRAKGIRLINGKTTCISCHNLKNPMKNHLVMENTGSRLCIACHLKM